MAAELQVNVMERTPQPNMEYALMSSDVQRRIEFMEALHRAAELDPEITTRGFKSEHGETVMGYSGKAPIRVKLMNAVGKALGKPITESVDSTHPSPETAQDAAEVMTAIVDVQKAHEPSSRARLKQLFLKWSWGDKYHMSQGRELYDAARGYGVNEISRKNLFVYGMALYFDLQAKIYHAAHIPPEKDKEMGKRSPWKEMVAVTPRKDLEYSCMIGKDCDFNNPNDLSATLYAYAKATGDVKALAKESLQPIGMIEYRKRKKTRVVELGTGFPTAIYKTNSEGVVVGKPIIISREEIEGMNGYESVREKTKEALNDYSGWLPLHELPNTFLAVNLDRQAEIFQPRATKDGFKIGAERVKPAIVLYNGFRPIDPNHLYLCSKVNHFVDGMLNDFLLKGGRVRDSYYKGVNTYFREARGKDFIDTFSKVPATIQYEQLGESTRVEVPECRKIDAGLATVAATWAYGSWIHKHRQGAGKIWEVLPESPSTNFALCKKGNPTENLHPASLWFANPDRYDHNSPFYTIRHVMGAVAALNGFKLNKEQVDSGKMTSNEQVLSMHLFSHMPESIRKKTMELNRSKLCTPIRVVAFPQTIVFEENGTNHGTVGSPDLPGLAFNRLPGKLALTYSIAPDSQFVKQEELMAFTKEVTPKIISFYTLMSDWHENGGDIEELNSKLDEIYFA